MFIRESHVRTSLYKVLLAILILINGAVVKEAYLYQPDLWKVLGITVAALLFAAYKLEK